MPTSRKSRIKVISDAIRTHFKPLGIKDACAVCGKYQLVCEAHHLVPVHQQAKFCIDHDVAYWDLPVWFVWLCPTHHAVFHAFCDTLSSVSVETKASLIEDMTFEERNRMGRLFSLQTELRGKMLDIIIQRSPILNGSDR